MEMATQIHLASIDGVYHYRRRIPKDLLALHAPAGNKISLKTKDKRKAAQRNAHFYKCIVRLD